MILALNNRVYTTGGEIYTTLNELSHYKKLKDPHLFNRIDNILVHQDRRDELLNVTKEATINKTQTGSQFVFNGFNVFVDNRIPKDQMILRLGEEVIHIMNIK